MEKRNCIIWFHRTRKKSDEKKIAKEIRLWLLSAADFRSDFNGSNSKNDPTIRRFLSVFNIGAVFIYRQIFFFLPLVSSFLATLGWKSSFEFCKSRALFEAKLSLIKINWHWKSKRALRTFLKWSDNFSSSGWVNRFSVD